MAAKDDTAAEIAPNVAEPEASSEAEPEPDPEADAEPEPQRETEPAADGRLYEADNVDHNDAVVSGAPPRPHETLVGMLQVKWDELKNFARTVEGEIPGDLGELLQFIRERS